MHSPPPNIKRGKRLFRSYVSISNDAVSIHVFNNITCALSHMVNKQLSTDQHQRACQLVILATEDIVEVLAPTIKRTTHIYYS